MCANSKIIRERQKAIRREMERRSITLKAVAFDSKIPLPTLATYFPADSLKEPVQIPGGAIFSLVENDALPDDLLDLLMPENRQIVKVPEGIDHNEVAQIIAEYQALKAQAHHPESPAGTDLSDCEKDKLDATIARIPRGAVGG